MKKRFFAITFLAFLFVSSSYAQQLTGTIRDTKTNEAIIGATIIIKGTATGTTSDLEGKFVLKIQEPLPVVVVITYIGYDAQEVKITSLEKPFSVKLKQKQVELKGAEITGSRISEKEKESALTVESMDRLAIKECAQTSFYEALGTLKGVDLTSASLGFTIINTRGFNSTSPVRSLQLIDGVDNQSPGLNFSLGNFLGSSELDVLKVDLISGASSAYYGPNAFNGVINITTRSPFVLPGLEVQAKAGERNLLELALRWAQVFKNKNGDDKFAYKLNAFAMKANDWVAENYDATPQSKSGIDNPGGYDAVNIYGDEYISSADFSYIPGLYPGLGIFYRPGYRENQIVDYNTENLKLGASLHYKIKNDVEAIIASNFGGGTTVYQGDNRYSLKDIKFFQQRAEVRKADKFFLRAYYTNEDAGNSYDAYFTALQMQSVAKNNASWSQDYYTYWGSHYTNKIRALPGFPKPNQYPTFTDYINAINPWLMANHPELINAYHDTASAYANTHISYPGQSSRFEPGTVQFDSAFKSITSKLFTEGGSRFYDKSALFHVQGEYKFTPAFMDILIGGNYRQYMPDSKGTIFQDTGSVSIINREYGIYGGVEKKFFEDNLKINFTARMDKNENFDLLFSPAASVVYNVTKNQVLRCSFSSAIRNPTLSDQYLFYRVSPLITLVGNINGFDSLVTIPSLQSATNTQQEDSLVYFNVAPIKPEEVKTIEAGYRGTVLKNIYVDIVGYYSWYNKFIGYKIGADVDYVPQVGLFDVHHIYRVSANAVDEVTTQGVSVGITYFFKKFFSISGNYSYNELNRHGSVDPLIPAYNTPKHKYNIGITGRDVDVTLFNKIHLRNFGFNVNYKWIDGFVYEGSPQFSGYVPGYSLVDAQVSYHARKIRTTFKLGASNLLDNKKFTVYGGPYVGRLAYISVYVDISKK